jgi:hypothetical protein
MCFGCCPSRQDKKWQRQDFEYFVIIPKSENTKIGCTPDSPKFSNHHRNILQNLINYVNHNTVTNTSP